MSNFRNRRGFLLLFLFAGVASAEPTIATFTLEDHLKRQWNHDLVFFPVATNVFGRKDVALLGPSGAPVSFQFLTPRNSYDT